MINNINNNDNKKGCTMMHNAITYHPLADARLPVLKLDQLSFWITPPQFIHLA